MNTNGPETPPARAGIRPVRLVLVGAGRLGELGYLPALRLAPEVTLAGIVDPAEDRAHALAKAWSRGPADRSPRTAADLPTLLTEAAAHEETIDGVVVASPVPTHVAVAAEAAAAGLLSLVEKPPAPDAAGAAELAALAPRPVIGFNRRFDPGAQAVRVAVARASSPPLTGIEVALQYRRASWQAVAVDDDVLADLGPHAIDWITWVARRRVAEITTAQLAHDTATVEGRLSDGTPFTVRLAADALHREELRAVGPDGATVGLHRLGGTTAAVTGRLRRGPHLLARTLTAQLSAFAHATRGQRSPLLGTAADGVTVMATVDAARTLAAGGAGAVAAPDPAA